jgi:GMP synthase-like glutamine amidotransferase
MTKRVLVIQHNPWEKPGRHMMTVVKERRVRLDICRIWNEPLPDLSLYDGLVVLGGSPNVDEENRYPFLKAEKEAIRRSVEEDMPYLGYCLGHQLLADALGAKVGPNFNCSIGFIQGQVTKDGRRHPAFRDIPQRFPLFKWHSKAVLPPLPKEIEILVTSPECEIEAISVRGRPHLLGLQFDNHAASFKDVEQWVNGDPDWLGKLGIDRMKLLMDAAEQEVLIGTQFENLFDNFLEFLSR